MLASAVYPAWDRRRPATWSPRIATTLLRTRLGFRGVSLTDSLNSAAVQRFAPAPRAGLAAARAGADIALYADPEAWRAAHRLLVAAALDGRLSRRNLLRSYSRILTLKRGLAR